MKHLFEFLNEEEKETWRKTAGDDGHAFRALMRDKYFRALMRDKYLGEINSDFSKLHPDNQRLLKDLLETVETVCDTLFEVGDVWMKDLQTLQSRRHDLENLTKSDINRISEGAEE